MNIGSTASVNTAAAVQATSEDKRMQLQSMLLKKSLDFQQKETDQIVNTQVGKGSIIDLRV